MEWTIKRLESSMASVFTDYFERIKFDHNPSWASCFCQFYQTDCAFEDWLACSGETNKQRAVEAIENGSMQGHLAFDGERVIGWLNANSVIAYPRLKEQAESLKLQGEWGLTICTVIDPNYRNKGIAKMLLNHAVENFKTEGYTGVLAFPLLDEGLAEKLYRGRVSTYLNYGYEKVDVQDGVQIMRLVF